MIRDDTATLKKDELHRVFSDSSTTATVLLSCLYSLYGAKIFDADLLEIILRVKQDIGVEMPNSLENKIGAAITALTTPWYGQEPEVFISVNKSLTSGVFDAAAPDMNSIEVEEILWGMYEVELLAGEPLEISPRVEAVIDRAIADGSQESGKQVVLERAVSLPV